MSSCEVFDSYINTIDVIEDSIDDNSKFPIVKYTKIKQICTSEGFKSHQLGRSHINPM